MNSLRAIVFPKPFQFVRRISTEFCGPKWIGSPGVERERTRKHRIVSPCTATGSTVFEPGSHARHRGPGGARLSKWLHLICERPETSCLILLEIASCRWLDAEIYIKFVYIPARSHRFHPCRAHLSGNIWFWFQHRVPTQRQNTKKTANHNCIFVKQSFSRGS